MLRNKAPRTDEQPLAWMGVNVPRSVAAGHMMIVGPPGSGKSHVMRSLMSCALLHRGTLCHSALVNDPKGENAAVLAGGGVQPEQMLVTDPGLQACTEVPSFAHAVRDAQQANEFAGLLIEQPVGDRNPYFAGAAKDIVSAALHVILELGGAWSLNDLFELCTRPRFLIHLLSHRPQILESVLQHLAASEQAAGVLGGVRQNLSPLAPLVAASSRVPGSFDIDSLIDDSAPKRVLLLSRRAEYAEGASKLNRILISLIGRRLLDTHHSAPGRGERLWLFADELPTLAAGNVTLDMLDPLLREGREPGGLRAALATQDLESLVTMTGSPERARSLIANCTTLGITMPVSKGTADYIRDIAGQVDMQGRGGRRDAVSAAHLGRLGSPNPSKGLPVLGRAQGVWWSGIVPPEDVTRYHRPADPAVSRAFNERRGREFLAPNLLGQADFERLGLSWPPPASGATEALGFELPPDLFDQD